MDLIYFTLWFGVAVFTMWDIRRTQLQSQMILERIEASLAQIEESAERIEDSAERIAAMTAEVLRRT